jgi:hypothetical protein
MKIKILIAGILAMMVISFAACTSTKSGCAVSAGMVGYK